MSEAAIFISYSRKDKNRKKHLCEHLEGLEAEGHFRVWSDTDMPAGIRWDDEIQDQLDRCELAILLVTRNFLASKYIREKEVSTLCGRHAQDDVHLFPIIAEHCAWQEIGWLEELNVRPEGGVPVWGDPSRADELLVPIVIEIAGRLRETSGEDGGTSARRGFEAFPANGVDTIVRGITALSELLMVPEVRSVAQAFHDDFAAARTRIAKVGYYKSLHDELHTLHTRCYTQLVSNARGFPDDEAATTSLYATQVDLGSILAELRCVEARAPDGSPSTQWIDSIERAAQETSYAIEREDAVGLCKAIDSLGKVLHRVPGRLDSRLNEAARDVDLPGLVRDLARVRDALEAKKVRELPLQALGEAVDELSVLEQGWTELVDQHSRWEEVEARLRMIDAALRDLSVPETREGDLDELRESWGFLRAETGDLAPPAPAEWRTRLRQEATKLASALSTGNIAGTRNHFVGFRSLAARRFFNVDKELKDLCDNMERLGERLTYVLPGEGQTT